MAERHYIEGYEEFCRVLKTFKDDKKPVYVLFSGSKLPNGESWCDDCVRAHPVIEEALQKFVNTPSHFFEVFVGDRPTWKDMKCPFRKDATTRLMVLPTLMKWNTPQKLEGDQCEKIDLIELLFTEDY